MSCDVLFESRLLATRSPKSPIFWANPPSSTSKFPCQNERLALQHYFGVISHLWRSRPNMKEDSTEPSNEPTHRYDCECIECQSKFGSLPLLARVVVERETTSASTSSDTRRTSFSCPHCAKTFVHRGDFNKHVRKHTGEQPYTCHICERKFAHTSNLNRHLRGHTGDRPYVCDVCNKTFNRKDKLDSHKRTKLCQKNREESKN